MQPRRLRRILLPLLAAAVVAAVYASASWSNQFVYDDHEVIEKQFPIRHLNDIGRIFTEPHYLNFPYYRPLTRLTFAIQMTISGQNPRPYHLFNALLAGILTLSTYLLLRRPTLALNFPAALIVATWFSLHPAISECVYPAASGRETLLPAIFILLATWAYLGPTRASYWLAMLMFAIALLCKEQAAVLPGIFLLADILSLTQRPRKLSASALRYLPIACVFIAYFAVRHLLFPRPTLHLEIAQHPLEPFKSLLYGLQTAITPFMALHYEPPFDGWFDRRFSAISLIVLAIILLTAARRPKTIRRSAIFWLGWFVIVQLPTAHILQQEADYSERYAALAILAFPAITAALVNISNRTRLLRAASVLAILWTILLGAITYLRGEYYSSELAFCIQWQNTNPDAAGPYDGFGRIAQEHHQPATAIRAYQKALTIAPDDATAHNNLANLLAEAGDFPGASRHYQWLLTNNSIGADDVATMTNYAQLLGQEAFDLHNPALRDRAHTLLEQAITLRPDYAQAHYILGEWNIAFGSHEAAIRQFKIALHLHPDWPEVQAKLKNLQTTLATQP